MYYAARTGQIPTIKLGRRLLVPVAALRRLLVGEANNWTATEHDELRWNSDEQAADGPARPVRLVT